MTVNRRRHSASVALVALMALGVSAGALAQEDAQPTTISAIDRGDAVGQVSLVGSALEQVDAGEYVFSDGTGVIKIDIDTTDAEAEVPLFTLIDIEGTVASDQIDVGQWAPLEIMTPAVIVPEEDVIEAFRGWIIAYGSQAPE